MSSDFIENLVVQTQNGNADAFGELYSVYAKDMYRFALYYTGSPFLAEDAVSDAALAAFRNIGRLKKKSAFRPWLFTILFNCCKKQQKEKALSLQKTELSFANDIPEGADRTIEKLAVKTAIAALEEDEREILLLSFIAGYSSGEIGKMLSMKSSSVRSKKNRTVAKLREMMR